MSMPRILVFVDYYLPGFKGGGPVQSVSRLIQMLRDDFEFALFTRDRDLGDIEPYPDRPRGRWVSGDDTRTFYARPDQVRAKAILAEIRHVRPDVIYLNSYFSKFSRIVLWLRAMGRLRGIAVLVAPRGEFSRGALQLKSIKKAAYLRLASAAGIHRRLVWQVSSELELSDTRAVIQGDPRFFIKSPDILLPSEGCANPARAKRPGEARFAFVSRISPKKNLLFAIEILAGIEGDVAFTIFGPAEDARYARECQEAAAALPPNVRCHFVGAIHPSEVAKRLSEEHFFLFPTLGENFGHVIPEALAAGCPVLVSDQTPWQDLDAQGAGWVMPLGDRALWHKTLQDCVNMDGATYRIQAESGENYVRELAKPDGVREANRSMFVEALAQQARRAA